MTISGGALVEGLAGFSTAVWASCAESAVGVAGTAEGAGLGTAGTLDKRRCLAGSSSEAHMAVNWARVAALSADMAMLIGRWRRRMLGARDEIASGGMLRKLRVAGCEQNMQLTGGTTT